MHLTSHGLGESPSPMPTPPGVVLSDGARRPIYFNREAIQVLAFPHSIERADELFRVLPRHVSVLLEEPAGKALAVEFRSGRRLYVCKLFAVSHNSQKPSLGVKGILLER